MIDFRVALKHGKEYITILEMMRIHRRVILELKPNANQIQVRLAEDSYDENLVYIGKSIGALKHDFSKGGL